MKKRKKHLAPGTIIFVPGDGAEGALFGVILEETYWKKAVKKLYSRVRIGFNRRRDVCFRVLGTKAVKMELWKTGSRKREGIQEPNRFTIPTFSYYQKNSVSPIVEPTEVLSDYGRFVAEVEKFTNILRFAMRAALYPEYLQGVERDLEILIKYLSGVRIKKGSPDFGFYEKQMFRIFEKGGIPRM